MPITERNGKWYWGEQGPYDTKEAAQRVATAAYLSGYKKKTGVMPKKKPYRGKFIRDGKIIRKNEDPMEKSKQWLIDTVEKAYPQVTNLKFGGRPVINGGYITFDCHNLKWRIDLNLISWIAPFGTYHVCVLSNNYRAALYDKFLTRIDVIASQTFGVVPVLEFAWELYQLDVAYPMFKFYGEYYTPFRDISRNTFFASYRFLKDAANYGVERVISIFEWDDSVDLDKETKMAKEKLQLVRELYQQIFGGNLE